MAGKFDHYGLKNIEVYLNSEVYPYDEFHMDFEENSISVLYKLFTNFQTSYNCKINKELLLYKNKFQKEVAIIVVDLSRKYAVKTSIVELKIKFDSKFVSTIGKSMDSIWLISNKILIGLKHLIYNMLRRQSVWHKRNQSFYTL